MNMRTKFSAEEKQTFNLALDLARCNYAQQIEGTKLTKADLEDKLRKTIKEDMLGGLTVFQAMRRNKNTVFEIVEEIVNTVIGEDVFTSPFVEEFVEVKNRGLGDTTAFYSEGGLLSVATFAGNHWDTNRQSIDLGAEVTLPKEWCYIHVYEDLERFLLGITPLDKLVDKIYKSIDKFFKDRIYLTFQNISNAVPSAFAVTGNTEAALGDLVDKVQAAGGYNDITIAGTKSALRKLAGVVPDKMFANSQKEAKASTGSIGEWEGNKLMVIPQVLIPGTYNTALDNSKVYILGGDTKPVKFEYYGDARTMENLDGKANADQSIDLQVQTKFGLGLVLSPYFGVFTFQ